MQLVVVGEVEEQVEELGLSCRLREHRVVVVVQPSLTPLRLEVQLLQEMQEGLV
jgi:hypothetical protein